MHYYKAKNIKFNIVKSKINKVALHEVVSEWLQEGLYQPLGISGNLFERITWLLDTQSYKGRCLGNFSLLDYQRENEKQAYQYETSAMLFWAEEPHLKTNQKVILSLMPLKFG